MRLASGKRTNTPNCGAARGLCKVRWMSCKLLKRGAVFQAWGQKGEEKESPHSLGTFYMDDPVQNRWVLKVDDGKALSRIDYIFVTDGSRKEGIKPKGKPLLSAFLNGTPNRP